MFYQYLLYPKYFCCLYLRYPMHFAKKMEILTNTILLDVKNWHSCWTREAIFNNTTMPDSSLFTPFQKTQIQIIDFEFFLPVPYPPTPYGVAVGEGVADSIGEDVGVGSETAAALLISSLY